MPTIDTSFLTDRELIDEIKTRALFFVEGPWPEIVQATLPSVFTNGQKYAVIIMRPQ